MTTLPTDSQERKDVPLARGCLDYFPAALAEVAKLSRIGNEKHNPGEEMHHARGKSTDHADCILRHLAERGTEDTDGLLHEVKVAWRALALLQESLEERGAPLARGAREPGPEMQEVPNNIHERIAGDTPEARAIKNEYYCGTKFMKGTPVKDDDGWTGIILEPPDKRGVVEMLWTHNSEGSPAIEEFMGQIEVERLEIL